jgi:hypothetical protein
MSVPTSHHCICAEGEGFNEHEVSTLSAQSDAEMGSRAPLQPDRRHLGVFGRSTAQVDFHPPVSIGRWADDSATWARLFGTPIIQRHLPLPLLERSAVDEYGQRQLFSALDSTRGNDTMFIGLPCMAEAEFPASISAMARTTRAPGA